jgi:hypothetical protein
MADKKERYQWIKGDDLGIVEIVSSKQNESQYLVFDSGRKCNREIISEFMVQIFDDSDIMDLGVDVLPKSKPKASPIKETIKEVVVDSSNPLIPILEKSKKSKIKLNSRINLEIPNKKFLAVMQESFDDDIIDVLSDYMLGKIKDPSKFLRNLIKNSLKDWYSN